ncbi:hypothetical protein ACIO8G_37320 [Streptomyces sp. NPDC087219]|uniref:hypothetical protein n=1 Tax=Streptomyces sp. NPDC087219 TaxID=3365770 RepID=UPI0037F51771
MLLIDLHAPTDGSAQLSGSLTAGEAPARGTAATDWPGVGRVECVLAVDTLVDQGTPIEAACRIIVLEDQLEEAQRINAAYRRAAETAHPPAAA